jgi:anti-anti-sigma factor
VNGSRLTVQHLDGGALHVAVHGAFDLQAAYEFDDAVRRIEDSGSPCVIVDLRDVHFLDSTGLARLVALRRRCRRDRRRLVLVRGRRAVHQLFAVAGVADQFEIVADPSAVPALR